mgnify:CR=1 FL=1
MNYLVGKSLLFSRDFPISSKIPIFATKQNILYKV